MLCIRARLSVGPYRVPVVEGFSPCVRTPIFKLVPQGRLHFRLAQISCFDRLMWRHPAKKQPFPKAYRSQSRKGRLNLAQHAVLGGGSEQD